MRKTAFLLIMILIFNMSAVCVQGAEITADINFEYADGVLPSVFSVLEENIGKVSIVSEESGSFLRLESSGEGTTDAELAVKRLNTNAVFEVSVRPQKLGGISQIYLVTADGSKQPLIRFSSDGFTYLANGSTVCKTGLTDCGVWTKYVFIINIYSGTYVAYKNGVPLADGLKLGTQGAQKNIFKNEGISAILFSNLDKNLSTTICDYDDILIYKGDKMLDEQLAEEKENAERTNIKEKLDGTMAFKPGKFYSFFNGTRRKVCRNKEQMIPVDTNSTSAVKDSLAGLRYEEYTPYEENGDVYIPAEFAFYSLGYVAVDYDGTYFKINIDGEILNIDAKENNKYVLSYKGAEHEFEGKSFEEFIFMPAKLLAQVMGLEIYKDADGFYIIGKDVSFFENEMNEEERARLLDLLDFERPTGDEMVAAVKAHNPNNQHPRLLIPNDRLGEVYEWRAQYDDYDKIINDIVAYAKSNVIERDFIPYHRADGKRILPISREYLSRLQYLAFAYNVSNDEEIAAYGIKLMEHICSYPDWNQKEHFLDTGEMCAAIAYGYDAFYNVMTEQQRTNIRQITYEYALKEAYDLHKYNMKGSWVMSEAGNWNPVCNSGLAMVCFVMCDDGDYEEEMSYLLERIYIAIELFAGIYAPEGSYPEGYGYWNYALEYVVRYIEALITATGDDFGYLDIAGLTETCYYALYMQGGAHVFNYHDTTEMNLITPKLFTWFGSVLGDENLQNIRNYYKEAYAVELGLSEYANYDPSKNTEFKEINIPLDKFYTKSIDDIAVMQTGWDNATKTYLGFYVGNPRTGHSQYESGTFVLDSMGVRWACDLGPDNYSATGYLSNAASMNFYRKRPEGNNCVVIDPGTSIGQEYICDIGITDFDSKAKGGYAIADLTDAYRQWAESYRRGTMLDRETGIVTIQDEIKSKVGSTDIWWFMHNRKEISIELKDGGKKALLSKDGKKMMFEIAAPQDAVFEVMEAEMLPTSPQDKPQGEYPRDEFQKLAIHLSGKSEATICVKAQPMFGEQTEPLNNMSVCTPLDEWSIDDGEISPVLTSLSFNGEELSDFTSKTTDYSLPFEYNYDGEFNITATAENADISIIQAKAPGTAIVTLTDKTSGKKRMYTVTYLVLPIIGKVPDGAEELKIEKYSVSSVPQEANVPENIFDNNLDTYWASNGSNEWLLVDLGSEKPITYMGASWRSGDTRTEKFDVYVSNNANDWTKVFGGQASGITSDFEYIDLGGVSARYLKLVMYGSNSGNWNSLQEFRLYTNAN